MPLDPVQLLRRLEPAVRRGGPSPAVRPVPGLAEAGFGDLLTMVASGRIRSERAVLVDPGAVLDPPLDERQLERLADAADEAEAAGARRAVMLLDGRGLVLAVAERRVEGEARPGDGALVGIDAAVAVPPDPAAGEDSASSGTEAASGAPGGAHPAPDPVASGSSASAGAARPARLGPPLGPPAALPAHVARAIPGRGTPLAGSPGLARPPG